MSDRLDMTAHVGATAIAADHNHPSNFQAAAVDLQGDFGWAYSGPIDKDKNWVGQGVALNYVRTVNQQDGISQASLLFRLLVVKGYADVYVGPSSFWTYSAGDQTLAQQFGWLVGIALHSGWIQGKNNPEFLPQFYIDPARFLFSQSLTFWEPTAGLQWYLQ